MVGDLHYAEFLNFPCLGSASDGWGLDAGVTL